MHEMSLAMNILEIALAQAKAVDAKQINQIEIEVGTLAGVMTDSLEFCFEAARNDTIAKSAQLRIFPIPGQAKCSECNSEFEVDLFFTPCPNCGGFKTDIVQGRDLSIRSINID